MHVDLPHSEIIKCSHVSVNLQVSTKFVSFIYRVELSMPLSDVVKSKSPSVDVLAGSNLDEGTEFMSLCPPISCTANSSELLSWCIEQFGPSLGPKVSAMVHRLLVDVYVPLCTCPSVLPRAFLWQGIVSPQGLANA
eukprot:m.159183 g.159183  ORF g.159183 m.159183 type:complete len:137 (-) comp17995_c0_seq3:266-676(-)